jgi:hypothetical protein
VLESRPRAQTELSGRRQVPKFKTAASVPFLSFKKHQSPFLTRIIRDEKAKMHRHAEYVIRLEKGEMLAAHEDVWDRLVGDMSPDGGEREVSWRKQLRGLMAEAEGNRRRDARKRIETARQMLEIVDKEKELFEQEREQRKLEKLKKYLERKEERLRDEKDSDLKDG